MQEGETCRRERPRIPGREIHENPENAGRDTVARKGKEPGAVIRRMSGESAQDAVMWKVLFRQMRSLSA